MSSNDQNASASPQHANQQRKVAGSAATSDLGAKIQSIVQKANSVDIVENDSDLESSSSREVPTGEIPLSTNSNDAIKSCQSPKDASFSSSSPKSILSSQHFATSNNTIPSTNYRSVNGTNQNSQDGLGNQNQDSSLLAKRMEPNSPAGSIRNSANNNPNRNINDRNLSFETDQTGQTSASRYRPQKYCAVCGDKAIACNFNAVTCESCKAFFRRNAFKEQRLKCLFDGRCVVDKVTRRFCSKCRLLKCFQIGMKREWILTDEQKQIKRVKILENKQSKHLQQQQQVSTSVLDAGSRGSLSDYPAAHSGDETKTDMSMEGEKCSKRRRTSSSLNYDANTGRAQKRDASTSCPDEADLFSGQILHHCTMTHQCQYCSFRLQSRGQPLHPVEQYQTNYRFQSSHRPYFEYNQHQQPNYQQQQQHFRYSQHGGHHYVGSQASSSAYSQQHMAAAASLKSAHVMDSAYAANIANASATDATQQPAGASQQAVSGVACAAPQSVPTCCCTSFNGIFQSQHCNRPPTIGNSIAAALPVVDHFANHSPADSNASCGSGPQLVYAGPQASKASAGSTDTQASKRQADNTAAIPNSVVAANSALDNLELHSMANGDVSTSTNRFLKGLTAPGTSLEAPSTFVDLVISDNRVMNEKQLADSVLANGCTTTKANSGLKQIEPDCNHTHDMVDAIQATNLAETSKQTLPDGSPIDISKHLVWKGIVYAQPAIAQTEMRARIELIDFTETERHLVYEMIDATKFMFEPTSSEKGFNDESLNDFVHFCDAALRRLIKTVKQIRAFRILSMDDQIMLLKTACFKILLLRSCLHYHDDIEGWRDRHGNILPLSMLKKAKSMVYDKHKEILTKLPAPLRKDRLIMGLMTLVLLFDPQGNLKHTNSVGLDNLIYLCVLRKYLIGTQLDPLEKYERLVDTTQVINACNEEYNVFFSRNFQPEQITPLLIEIFDISINNSV